MLDLFKTKKEDASALVKLDALAEANKNLSAQVAKLSILAARMRKENKQLKEKMQRLKAKLYDAEWRDEEKVDMDAAAAKNREETAAIHEMMHSPATMALERHLKRMKKEGAK